MPSLADLLVRVGIDSGPLKAGLKSVSDDFKAMDKEIRATEKAFAGFEKIGDRMSSVGAGLTAGITLPLAAIGIAASKVAGDFQMSFNKVQAFGDITGASLDKLKAQALDLGAKTVFSAQQAADGMAVFASAGMNANQIYAAMPGTLNLAAAGQLAVADAAKLAKDVMGQFGLEAAQTGRVADILAQASADASASLQDMGLTLTYVGPNAHALGQSLEETTAAIIALDVAGLRGEKAGTGLRGVLGSLLGPSKEAAKEIDKLGISVSDSTGKIRPLSDIMEQFKQKLAGVSGDTERARIMFEIFGREASNAAQILIKTGGPALDAFEQKLISSEGAAAKMAKILQQGLKGSLEQFKGSVETAAISLGTALLPVMGKALDLGTAFVNNFVLPAVKAFGQLPTPVQAFALVLTGLAAAAGPVIFIVGQLVSSVGSIATAFTAASGVLAKFPALAATVSSSLSVAAIAAGAFAAAIVIGAQLYQLQRELSDTAEKIELNTGWWAKLKLAFDSTDTTKAVAEIKYAGQACRESAADVLEMDLAWRRFKEQFTFGRLIEALTGPLGALTAAVRGFGETVEAFGGKYVSMEKAATDSAKKLQKSVAEKMKAQLDAAQADVEAAKQAKKFKDEIIKVTGEVDKHGKAHKEAEMKARNFMDTQPVLAARLRLVDAEYKKTVESLAALQLALDRNGGIVWSFDQFALATDRLGAEIGQLGTSVRDLPQMPGYTGTIKELDDLGKAYERMGVKTTGELRKLADQHQADFNRIKGSGIATAHELELAWWKLMESLADAARQAGEEIPIEIEAMLSVGTKHTKEATEKQKTIWEGFGKNVSTVITNFAQDISKSLWDGDISWGEKGKNLLKSLGQAVTSSFIEPATAAIGKFINGVLADLLSGKGFGGILDRVKEIGSTVVDVFGGGSGTPSAPGGGASIPTGGGGGGGAGVPSGLGGTVDIITGAITAAAGVVSAIYNVRIEGTLNAIEENTRKAQVVLIDTLNRANEFWPSMRDSHAALVDLILPTMRELRDGMKNLFAVNLSLTPGDERNLINSLLTRFATPDTLSSDRLLDIHARLGNVLTAVQDTRKGIVETIASSTQLLVGGLAAIENKLPSTIGNILGGIGGLGGIAGAVSGLVGSLITGLINRGQGEAIDLIEENTRYAAIGIVGPHGVVESMREFLPEMKAVRELSGQFLDAHAWRIHDVWERIGTLIDVVKFDTNAHLWGIHEALVTAGPREVHNHFEGATFANRSDIDYAVEQISRNLR